jgi:hypothetical protein
MTPEGLDGEVYALCVLDDCTEYSAVVLLKNKNQAARELITILKQWETQTGSKVQFIRTDNGSEFSGIAAFCKDNGAVHQKTAPYVHQQNGKIERLNRTLQERARAMLAGSTLPEEYWSEALLTANYVRNLSAVSNLTHTPHQAFFDKVPDVSHLRVFGSKCFVLTPKHKRGGKFFPVSSEGVFLGYDGMGPNYRILLYSKIEIVAREHAKFSELSVDNSEEPNDPHSDVPDLIPHDESDDEYEPPEGVQSTEIPYDVHDVADDVSAPLKTGEGMCSDDNTEQSEGEQDVESRSQDVPVAPADKYGGGRYPARIRGVGVPRWYESKPTQPAQIPAETLNTSTESPFLGYVQVQKDTLILEPVTYFEATNSPEAEKWLEAMRDEMHSLSSLGTWSYVEVTDKERKKVL